MLEYVKTILQKVSFDKILFEKELNKSISKYLKPNEVEEFRDWCYQMFNPTYPQILDRCFNHSMV
ncbi:hypothetical protein [Microscilla marina]|uniref:Uncharacterized protein n=1 Tax=Microscilla marina ATCC 23134 TaxID=313606 RepID=A1ZJ69_MICM2|nr:hypothetical protein [Microscilla marina]EAY29605.1 hypothetical protein M23134_00489 [Microscilla marina ATCC 23134]